MSRSPQISVWRMADGLYLTSRDTDPSIEPSRTPEVLWGDVDDPFAGLTQGGAG